MGSKGDGISLRSDETFGPQECFPSVRSTAYEPPISAELPMGKILWIARTLSSEGSAGSLSSLSELVCPSYIARC